MRLLESNFPTVGTSTSVKHLVTSGGLRATPTLCCCICCMLWLESQVEKWAATSCTTRTISWWSKQFHERCASFQYLQLTLVYLNILWLLNNLKVLSLVGSPEMISSPGVAPSGRWKIGLKIVQIDWLAQSRPPPSFHLTHTVWSA